MIVCMSVHVYSACVTAHCAFVCLNLYMWVDVYEFVYCYSHLGEH